MATITMNLKKKISKTENGAALKVMAAAMGKDTSKFFDDLSDPAVERLFAKGILRLQRGNDA